MTKKEPKIRIALIEDDPFLSSMYFTKFEMEGFKVLTATDGEAGIDLIIKEKPDLVLLDILMPKKNGLDVLEIIKKNKDTQAIPIILLTNLNQTEEVKRAMDLGAVDYLIKAHFMPSEVVDKIKKALENKLN